MKETVRLIKERYGTDITVPAIQQYLSKGSFLRIDRIHDKTEMMPFADILEEASNLVCDQAIQKLRDVYDSLYHYDYLVLTGGTGEAWCNRITDAFKGISTLSVVSGAENDDLPCLFSNARGYYLTLQSMLKRRSKSITHD